MTVLDQLLPRPGRPVIALCASVALLGSVVGCGSSSDAPKVPDSDETEARAGNANESKPTPDSCERRLPDGTCEATADAPNGVCVLSPAEVSEMLGFPVSARRGRASPPDARIEGGAASCVWDDKNGNGDPPSVFVVRTTGDVAGEEEPEPFKNPLPEAGKNGSYEKGDGLDNSYAGECIPASGNGIVGIVLTLEGPDGSVEVSDDAAAAFITAICDRT